MRKRKSTLPILLFIALVALTGYGLATTGHLNNPFAFLSQTQGDRRPANFDSRSTGDAPATPQFAQRGEGGPDEGGSTISINWSQAGDVLFNLWYLAATTAVVIVVQKVGGFLIKQIRPRRAVITA